MLPLQPLYSVRWRDVRSRGKQREERTGELGETRVGDAERLGVAASLELPKSGQWSASRLGPTPGIAQRRATVGLFC